MALTSIELIDALRQSARLLEAGTVTTNLPLPLHHLLREIKAAGISTLEPASGFSASLRTEMPENDKIAGYLRHCADTLENQLLAILDLPVGISLLQRAA